MTKKGQKKNVFLFLTKWQKSCHGTTSTEMKSRKKSHFDRFLQKHHENRVKKSKKSPFEHILTKKA